MNKNLRIAISIAAAVSLAGGAMATGATAATKSKITIASVYGNTYDPFWTSLGCGAKAQAKAMGVTYKEFTSTAADNASFDQSFNSAQLIQANGLMINPLNPDQFATQQQQLMKAGVPVVTINGSNPPSQYRVVGTDVTNESFLSGLDKIVPSGAGKVAIINGVPGLVPVDVRLNPVVAQVLKANSSLKALDPQYTFFDSNKASAATSALLVANPDLKVIIAGDGPDGSGVAAAVKAAGMSGKVTVIALDAVPTEVSALKDGTISALVAQAPARIGATQLKTLVDYLKAAKSKKAVKVASTKIGVPQKLLTKANVDLKANSDWVYATACK